MFRDKITNVPAGKERFRSQKVWGLCTHDECSQCGGGRFCGFDSSLKKRRSPMESNANEDLML